MVNKITPLEGESFSLPPQQKTLSPIYSGDIFLYRNGIEISIENLGVKFKAQEYKLYNFIKNCHLDPISAVCLINNLYKLNEDKKLAPIRKFMDDQSQFPSYLGAQILDFLISFFSKINISNFMWDAENSSLDSIFLFILVNQDEKGTENIAIYQNFLMKARLLNNESLTIQFCMLLAEHRSSVENKRQLLKLLSSCEDLDFRKELVYAGSFLLVNPLPIPDFNSFEQLEKDLEKILNEPFPELKWTIDQYYQTFGTMRDPFAFASFFSRITKNVNDEKVIAALKKLIKNTMGDYTKERYKQANSQHFSACVKSQSFDADEWVKGDKCEALGLLPTEKNPSDSLDYSQLVLEDTDSLEDLLLFSKECDSEHYPRFDEDFFTEALLGLVLNSKNRLLVLRDKFTSRIMAFRMLKLCLKINEPVLCLEAYQSIDPENDRMRNFLENFAKKRAESLKLPLYFENSTEKAVIHTLQDTIPLDYFFYNNCYTEAEAIKFET